VKVAARALAAIAMRVATTTRNEAKGLDRFIIELIGFAVT